MNNTEIEILQKCGWSEDQLNYLGTMVYDIEKEDGTPIMSIISHRSENEIMVQWLVPNEKIEEKIFFNYLLKENQINLEKSSHEIKSSEDMHKMLDIIEAN